MEDEKEVVPATSEEQEGAPEKEEPVKPDARDEAIRQLTARAKKAEADRKALEIELNKKSQGEKPALDVEDYIDISASLEGLDQKEKERLAREHKLTGKPLGEIRKDEDFLLWQAAYQQKREKENQALRPSGTQSESDKPTSFTQKLKGASLEEKEKMLSEAGLYKSPRPHRADRTNIGAGR